MLQLPSVALLSGRRPFRRKTAEELADPALRAYLNEQLAAVTGLAEQLRRASAMDVLIAERTTLLRVRRDVAADRTTLRSAMRQVGASTDWAVVGVSWLSAYAGRVTPLLHRLPVVDRFAGVFPTHPTREAVVEALLVLEDVLGGLHRRVVAARLLADLVAGAPTGRTLDVHALAERAQVQLDEVEAAHRRCAAPLLKR